MTNSSAAKGARAELAVVKWLRDFRGFRAERVRSGRSTDAGDVVWPESRWHVDVKDQKAWRVREWMLEAERECVVQWSEEWPDRALQPLLILKVPGETDPGKWWAVVRMEDLEL